MTALPLEHVRAIVLTQAWAGTLTTQLLGDFGADVIQIEALRRPDTWRGGYGPDDLTGVYPDDDPGERPYNRCARFNSVNRNKRALTLDLGTADGRRLFLELVRQADVVAENFASRVMGNFSLDYDALREVKPDLIMIAMPAYGRSGPYAPHGGIGGTAEPMSGISMLQGEAGGPPLNSGIMYPDPVAGMMGCAAILIALHHRQRTGEGQFIDLALQEPSICFIGEQVLEAALTGRQPRRWGNRDRWHAPHGTYRCAGDDRWVSIAVRSQSEWDQLCAIVGQPWTDDARFATPAARREHAEALDAALAAWTQTQEADRVMARLQAAGIPAATVFTPWTVTQNPQLQARDFFVTIEHPEAGTHRYAGIPWKMSRTPGRVRMPPPWAGATQRSHFRRRTRLVAADCSRSHRPRGHGPQPATKVMTSNKEESAIWLNFTTKRYLSTARTPPPIASSRPTTSPPPTLKAALYSRSTRPGSPCWPATPWMM